MALFGLVGFIFFSFRNERAVATSAAQQWPGQMGTLDAVAERWPRQEANRASFNLTSLAETLPKNDKALDDFLTSEIARDELTISEPPTLPDVSAVRNLILQEPIVWERHQERWPSG